MVLPLTTIDDITAEAAADVVILADQLAALTGGVAHGAVFGNGETLTPGVYDVSEAASIQGTLTLDAQGDSSALFVFRISGALSSVAASEVVLANGAIPANIYWRADGAVSLGANTTFAGTAIAVTGAASDAAGSTLHGRLLSTEGAVSINSEQLITVPDVPLLSPIRLGVLSTFVMFSAIGAVSNTGTSTVVGDIGSNLGSITGFVSPTTVDGTIYTAGSSGLTPNTKELRQRRKLELAAVNRAADGNARATYDVAQLPTKYSDNVVFDNPNPSGLVIGRPWISSPSFINPTLTLGSAVTTVTQSPFAGGGSSYSFISSVDSYIDTPASADWAVGTDDFTIEWFSYQTTLSGFQRAFTVDDFASIDIGSSIENGAFYYWANDSFRYSSSAASTADVWIHWAIVRASGITKVYKNGVLRGSQITDTNNITNTVDELTVGNENTASTIAAFVGYLTNFRWIKGLAVYTGNFTVPTSELTATASTNPYGGSNTQAIPDGVTKLLLVP